MLIEGKKISAVQPEHQRAERAGDRRLEVDRDAGLRRYPPSHVAGLPAQRPAGRLARGLLATSCSASSAPRLTPDDVYAADLLSALGAIDAGVTCVLDWSHIHNSPEHTDAAIKGLQESGVRAVFAYGSPQNETGRVLEDRNRQSIPATSRGCASSISPATISSSRSTWRRLAARPRRHRRSLQGRARCRRAHHHPCRRRRVRPQRAAGEAQRRARR